MSLSFQDKLLSGTEHYAIFVDDNATDEEAKKVISVLVESSPCIIPQLIEVISKLSLKGNRAIRCFWCLDYALNNLKSNNILLGNSKLYSLCYYQLCCWVKKNGTLNKNNWVKNRLNRLRLYDLESTGSNSGKAYQKPKVAVIVTGQLRGEGDSLPSVRDFLEGTNYSIFFNVWDKYGFRAPAANALSLNHLRRLFDDSFVDLLQEYQVDFETYNGTFGVTDFLQSKKAESADLKSYFSGQEVQVHVEPEEGFEKRFDALLNRLSSFHADEGGFAKPSNMLKMLYMNYLSLEQIKKSVESFDYILRVRPDFIINPHHNCCELIQNVNLDDVVITDEWHGEISDQFALSSKKNMITYLELFSFLEKAEAPLLDITNLSKPHKRLTDYFIFNELRVLPIDDLRKGFDLSLKLSIEKHQEVIRKSEQYKQHKAPESMKQFIERYLSL
ncbi:hypothetical protein FJN13_16210 [Alteromonas mediterranea]|uniref:hypothetical protein n=1 Tax=Alteromonas mediterranea TaxID=314275 RepID=UPI0011315B05|nr:hypothetical protein [Alteromonas mediterranea]QDG36256.1 hypothetical protein FJN13_16210 [Alteromonas mediterranea]